MEHAEHVALIRGGVEGGGLEWIELGSGGGAFTLALADLLGPSGRITSVDRDRAALRRQGATLAAAFPATHVDYLEADFSRPLGLAARDGVLMANSLHFSRDQAAVLQQVGALLRPGGRLVVVEYDTDRGNHWVPHPLSYRSWERVSREAGFRDTRLLARRPGSGLAAIYSALSFGR
ncbi:MAG: class I SAM-dependent methyltransferase [Candidatus Dormibacter sp.]|uniref:class I SAM-dependent methyltransferase n=1 Tax=Candidatus Dormibacter sp. TaxID=2973982 RepID=UPI000DB443AC|nr:MAG: class I SAM-dependent methyltransferase [Candidatus Dormibacteraeota bacterium]